MAFKVVKLTVGKGKTTGDEKAGEWNRQYFEVEAAIEDETQIELAKNSLEALLDMWLKGESILESEKPSWDPSKIKWEEAEGSSGPYEKSDDVNSLDFKTMLKDLAAHGGRLTRDGMFYWTFKNGSTVGRKRREKTEPPKQQPQTQKQPQIEELKKLFPADLEPILNFEVEGNCIIIKPRQFLGSENFSKIMEIIKAKGGKYVSNGKNSHFELPLK